MFCVNCGAKLKEDVKFCSNCGADLDKKATPAKYSESKGNNSVIFWILFALFILIMGACFLPYFSILGIKCNFVFFDPGFGDVQVKDGVFLLIFEFLAIILLLFKNRIPVFIFQVLSLGIMIIDLIADADKKVTYEVGFYLLLVLLITTIVLSLIRLILKKKFK